MFRSLRPAGPLDRPEEIEGMALEGLVAQYLRAWIAYRASGVHSITGVPSRAARGFRRL
ncbi:protein of unknown function [Georgfuchsia toluolica]|uniref:Uncharacterized protein n=1 Tax=Georgfuchsia toluolica TaxID=424218 RepID=A0A916J695_9PROT|nr:protein of unknown function [Georgfuchsia toluolica]